MGVKIEFNKEDCRELKLAIRDRIYHYRNEIKFYENRKRKKDQKENKQNDLNIKESKEGINILNKIYGLL